MNILETNRLVLRLLELADAADLHRIYSDHETVKFMGKAPDSVEEERNHIQAHITNHYEKYGVGLWATVLKENNRLIGRCRLMRKQIEGVEEVEIAYLLDREYWGKGLATEAAEAIIKHGHAKYGFKRIVAVIHPQNVASIRVAEKIGMKYERDVLYGAIGNVALYALEA
ncbi:MAG TPA: GNAT family N-acetyltransferase [Blastocatellia bacterium]|jgi:Acetyltransferases, including N-acetylases of ribosomal proteins